MLSRPTLGPNAAGVVLKGGTSTTGRLVGSVAPSTPSGSPGGRERMLTGSVRVGLARCWVLREQPVRGCCLGRDLRSGRTAGSALVPPCKGWWWCGCGRRREPGVTGGCLRTAQWTRASLNDLCGQVYKCTGWMPWHQEPKKDVVACDKPRGVGKRTVIRGFPNGETPPQSCVVTLT